MAKHFDPRKVLKQISNELLRELFSRRSQLQEVSWGELSETNIEPIFAAWQQLPGGQAKEVQVILQDVNELADERGLSVLAEEVQRRCPERMPELAALDGRCDKAMWMYLNVPEAFDEAALFARADALATGRYWVKRNTLPRQSIVVDERVKKALQDAMSGHYWPSQMRGRYCSVDHYQRANGAEYFFAYLDDYPDKHLVFDDSGKMEPRADRYAFTNVFVFCPNDGTLELYAQGGRKTHEPLQELFCRAVLGVEIGPADPDEAAYQLDDLKRRDFPMPTDPADCVEVAQVRKLRLEIVGEPRRRIVLEADPNAHAGDIYRMMERYLNQENLPLSKVRVTHATFRLTFAHEGAGRARTLTFNVGHPDSCDLKSKPDDMRAVGERCMKLWGIAND